MRTISITRMRLAASSCSRSSRGLCLPASILARMVTSSPTRRLAEQPDIFEMCSDVIERVASDKYDRTARHAYEIVTITTDDLPPLMIA
jgi:hypothetical protein